ncbi:GTPase Era [Candidatus Poriferisodalis sp.]|uniref:GTPase Era n=1 Tax=Candidatus Poriferisodalis sp. TaxID=3101277 RepID=UPI003C6ED60B
MHSGFVTLVGRPNAGKSTLLNCLVGAKVSITSAKPQTTRLRVMGVRHLPEAQIVFVDTPGIGKPVTPLGEKLNETARTAVADLEPPDVICMVLDATAPLGRGDRLIWDSLPAGTSTVIAVTKCDRASRAQVLAQLAAAAELDAGAYFPVSGRTGEGTDALLEHFASGLGEGPAYFPPESITDLPDAWRISEAVREQLLARLADELPYSIAVRVTEWEPDRIRCDIAVERSSQKGIVIGRGGRMLREVGTAARRELGLDGVYLELRVRVEPDWQRTPDAVARMLAPEAPSSPHP